MLLSCIDISNKFKSLILIDCWHWKQTILGLHLLRSWLRNLRLIPCRLRLSWSTTLNMAALIVTEATSSSLSTTATSIIIATLATSILILRIGTTWLAALWIVLLTRLVLLRHRKAVDDSLNKLFSGTFISTLFLKFLLIFWNPHFNLKRFESSEWASAIEELDCFLSSLYRIVHHICKLKRFLIWLIARILWLKELNWENFRLTKCKLLSELIFTYIWGNEFDANIGVVRLS